MARSYIGVMKPYLHIRNLIDKLMFHLDDSLSAVGDVLVDAADVISCTK